MTTFAHEITYRLPADPVGQILEFSPAGKHLAIGDNIGRGIHIVDCTQRSSVASFVATAEIPSSFVWDPVQLEKCVVGFVDGTFILFAEGREESRVDFLHERGTITTLALSSDGLVLAVAVDLDNLFVFHRESFADKFECEAEVVFTDRTSALAGAPPMIPRSLCFSFNGTFFISYERHGLIAIPPDGWLVPANTRIPYLTSSEGRFLNSVTSDRYPRSLGYERFWLCSAPEATPFLFVDGGSMIVCLDNDGRVVLKDSVTRRSKQYLDHHVVRRGAEDPPPYGDDQGKIIAYCVVGGRQKIAILTGGVDAGLALWSAPGPFPKKLEREGSNGKVQRHETIGYRERTVVLLFLLCGLVFALSRMLAETIEQHTVGFLGEHKNMLLRLEEVFAETERFIERMRVIELLSYLGFV